MIQEFHREKDNSKASITLDSIAGSVYFLDMSEWNDYSVMLSDALCSFILPKDMTYCSDGISVKQIPVSIPSAYREQSVRWIIRVLLTVFLCIKACMSETELPNHIK
jgi:hypothetical protein